MPGIQERNSRLPILLFFANSEIFRSSVPAPASITSLSIKLIFEKLGLSFITAPLTPLSLIRVFEPAPKIVIFKFCFFISFKNSIFYFRV